MDTPQTLYEVLGVSRNATPQELKQAFRALSLQYHPDRNHDPEAQMRFQEIVEAYGVLSHPVRRRVYDGKQELIRSPSDLFKRHPSAIRTSERLRETAQSSSKPGKHLVIVREVPSKILTDGGRVWVVIPAMHGREAQEICLSVPVGHRLARMAHLGEPGYLGGEAGDLFVLLIEKKEKP
ncbi:MAG: Heat shock protein DnaJ domain protein [Candidatus Uhrbacteria bacterium GW2011_GWE2_40_58]|nr:MAG: Heat shock protein DnaJ domain protein [Candidatus Uhrbacteria bacterium GW2011_GWF2_40_263]KKR68241.1 MAG: Heat shock protein DnaJ domain protein [Candidatus Uhrbacteria bacterium GW2011_GWE2_40_58]OGL92045.1 MAG: hypothetical protein A2239_03460 [Candidatus Uhrbacteria bacterium RIFOXYA2_FULL_40_9]OGL97502.1 MAG: hypothetical protein A2332_00165 [Candidatus Uhrbacteria bacterium RIFOXYB2_FULL_41_18]HBK35111.1 hypothetical protein [Candidatus Uhrbacteria bacterium]